MQFLILTMSLAMLVWAVIVLLHGSVFLSTALFIVATCVFPAEFFSVDAGGLTWTLDRLWFAVLIGQGAIRWYRGELSFKRLENCDLAVALFALWLIARTITQPLGSLLPEQPPTLMHLVNGYLIPFTLYAVLRTSRLNADSLKPALGVLLALGVYLSVTAILEVSGTWSLVVPSFIGDPDLGIHFGRARGPMLQSVRLGICLIAGWIGLVVYTVWIKPDCRFQWAAFILGTLLLGSAIFFTYTRSVWLGFACGISTVVIFALQGRTRQVAIAGLVSVCCVVGIVKGPELVAFKREYSAAETEESTYMRAAFAYVSLEMFKDRPISGFGFNQFQVHNREYLADRSTTMRLEAIRGYVHHNSYLSLLVDLGIVGLSLFAFMAFSFAREAWALWWASGVPNWARGLSLMAFVIAGMHLIQMAFHEVSYSPIENSLLFSVLGLVIAAKQQFCVRQLSERSTPVR